MAYTLDYSAVSSNRRTIGGDGVKVDLYWGGVRFRNRGTYYRSGNKGFLSEVAIEGYRSEDYIVSTIAIHSATLSQTGSGASKFSGSPSIRINLVGSLPTSASSAAVVITYSSGSASLGGQASAHLGMYSTIKMTSVSGVTYYGTVSDSGDIYAPQLEFIVRYYDGGKQVGADQKFAGGDQITIRSAQPAKTGKFTLTYNTNGGSSVTPGTGNGSQKFSTGGGYTPGTKIQFTSNQDLEAKYSDNISYPSTTVKSTNKNNTSSEYVYYVSFYSLGSLYETKSTNTGRETIKYTFKGYRNSYDGNTYNPGNPITLYTDTTLTANGASEPQGKQPLRLQSVPSSPTLRGYKFVGWVDKDKLPVTAGMTVDHNFDAFADGIEKTYTVQYVINGDKNQIGQGPGAIKTYGISDVQIPTAVPTKFGYTFDGGTSEDGKVPVQKQGAWLDDRIYNYITDTTGAEPTTVKLYAKGIPIKNKVRMYCGFNDSSQSQGDEEYTVEDLKTYNNVQCYYYKEAPIEQRGESYVFIGWCQNKPDNWDTNHGVYSIADDAPDNVLPFYVKKSDITEASQGDGDISNYLGGIGSKTGKYVKLPSGWKKVNMAYVKVNGSGRPVHDFYTCVDDTSDDPEIRGKHEI